MRSLYRRSQTFYEHERWAIKQWGLGKFVEGVQNRLAAHLAERTQATLSINRLEEMAYEWRYRAYLEMPRRRPTITVRLARWKNSASVRKLPRTGTWSISAAHSGPGMSP
jgi:hypothetical protein